MRFLKEIRTKQLMIIIQLRCELYCCRNNRFYINRNLTRSGYLNFPSFRVLPLIFMLSPPTLRNFIRQNGGYEFHFDFMQISAIQGDLARHIFTCENYLWGVLKNRAEAILEHLFFLA